MNLKPNTKYTAYLSYGVFDNSNDDNWDKIKGDRVNNNDPKSISFQVFSAPPLKCYSKYL